MDRTGVRARFQFLPHVCREVMGDMNVDGEFADAANRRSRHFLADIDRGAGEIPIVALRHDPHDRQHAGSQCRRDEVGRRKRLSLSMVINRWIGEERGAAGAMRGFAAEVAEVADVDVDHEVWMLKKGRDDQVESDIPSCGVLSARPPCQGKRSIPGKRSDCCSSRNSDRPIVIPSCPAAG